MSEEFVTLALHEEFSRRIDAENERQNIRLTALEAGMKEISRITVSVEKLAANMETMVKEQERQGERLNSIEQKPAKRWDVVITGAISAIVGALMAALMSGAIH